MIFSGIQPTGILTLGNYLGALKEFTKLKEKDALYCIVDLHALTSNIEPKDLRYNTKYLAAVFIAMGLHETGKIFVQSTVSEHSELAWFLQSKVSLGDVERMTQFKDKSENKVRPNVGLLTYPLLMAADILLYDTDFVPVGEDQKQHLELTRNIVQKLNSKYNKELFKEPEPVIAKQSSKIFSLTDPSKKMSKSSDVAKSYITLSDTESQIKKKISGAVTDSIGKINLDKENQPGIYNLLQIYASINNISLDKVYEKFKNESYGFLKSEVASSITCEIIPLQNKINEILKDEEKINKILDEGSVYAKNIASKKMKNVKKTFGIY